MVVEIMRINLVAHKGNLKMVTGSVFSVRRSTMLQLSS